MGVQLDLLSAKVQEAVSMIGAQAQEIKALSDQVSILGSQASGLNEQIAAVNADYAKLQELAGLKPDLLNRDFLLTWEHSLDEIRSVLHTAEILRALYDDGRSLRVFDTGLAVSIFRDQSTRTRFSSASAAGALDYGGYFRDLDGNKLVAYCMT